MMPFNLVARVKNMTRETKLGLAVSCSFLGLLGVVLALKLTERPEEDQGGAEVAAAGPGEAPPAAKPGPTPVAQQTGPAQEPGPFPVKEDPNVRPVAGPVTPPAQKSGAKPSATGNASSGLPDLPDLPPTAPPPATPVGSLGFWDTVAKSALTNGTVVPALPPALPPVTVATAPNGLFGPFLKVARTRAALPPVASADTVPPPPPPLPPIPGEGGNKPAPGAGGWFTTAALAKASGASTAGALPPPLPALPPAAAPSPLLPENKDTVPPLPALPGLPPAEGPGKAVTGAAPAKSQDTVPSIDVQGIEVGTGGGKPIKVGEPVPGDTKQPPVAARPSPPAVPRDEPIVVGVRPSAAVPPLSLPAAPAVRSAQPDVVSYTEESYVAGAGDTFRSISKAKYGTEAYGQALYLFNRSHPLAGDDLLQSDALKARQTVYVPPAQVLESRYAGAVNARSGVTVGSTSQRAEAPRSYRVAVGGEKVYDIARNLLGDGNRWVEIQKLNPGWNWEVPLPPGVTLQVPSDARLPQ
jgi:hypothetical protein